MVFLLNRFKQINNALVKAVKAVKGLKLYLSNSVSTPVRKKNHRPLHFFLNEWPVLENVSISLN